MENTVETKSCLNSGAGFWTTGIEGFEKGDIVTHDELPSVVNGQGGQEDGVAIVGMACRAPGGNDSIEKLWRFLLDGKSAVGPIPPMRWAPLPHKESVRTISRGYFLERLEDFDAQFFGISPREAEQMDPQQRISLEVAYESLENAGIQPQGLSGSDTAVFWGVNSDDYARFVLEDLANVDAWMGIGTAHCGVPNRISYHLDLNGPSTAVDAACASSLVAIHHAREAILQGEANVAVAGGVNAILTPALTRVYEKAGVLSPDGCCRSFDDAAQGYGRGEGAGAIVLKKFSQAVSDGDHILAILKSTAVAQDGKTRGIMAPNPRAQQLVAEKALKRAAINPRSVQYIEAHATSTAVGDPIEVSAMSAVYGHGRPRNNPCFMGSIKSNVGHLEAGAGVMGFIKAVLTVHHGVIPPQVNLQTLNKKIDWTHCGIRIATDTVQWPTSNFNAPRRAAVCSYGNGGVVAHAIIQEYKPLPSVSSTDICPDTTPLILPLSGPQEKHLEAQATRICDWLDTDARHRNFRDIISTLSNRRSHHDYRAALIVDGVQDAIRQLKTSCQRESGEMCRSNRHVLGRNLSRKVIWVFSGHGAQWQAMGKELVGLPIFTEAIVPLSKIVEKEIGFSPIEALRSGCYETSDQVQILTYILQIGIAQILAARGIRPDAVMGHSVGELAASVVAGSLTAEEGTLIVTHRARLYRQVMGQGGMIMMDQPAQVLKQMLEKQPQLSQLCVAIESSPNSCVVSGPWNELSVVKKIMEDRGTRTFKVKTDIAFHSPSLKQLISPLLRDLHDSLAPRPSKIPLYSTSLLDPRAEESRGPQFWVNNMVSPVRLTSAVEAALDDDYRIFLEVSAHPIISQSIKETILHRKIDDYAVIPTMLRNQPALKQILRCIGELYCLGLSINWARQLQTERWAAGVPTTSWVHVPLRIRGTAPETTEHNKFQHPASMLSDIVPAELAPGSRNISLTTMTGRQQTLCAEGQGRRQQLTGIICVCVEKALHIPANDIDLTAELWDKGLDSMMTEYLRQELEDKLKLEVPARVIWSHPTVDRLTSWYEECLDAQGAVVK